MASDFSRLKRLLRPLDLRRLVWIGILIAFAGVLQLFSLGALYSFLSSLATPANDVPALVRRVALVFGAQGPRATLVVFAAICLGLLVVGNTVLVFVERAKFRLEALVQASLATRLLSAYLSQEYPFFLHENTARLSKNVLHSSREVVSNGLRPALDLANKVTQSCVIVALLLLVDPSTTLLVGAIFGFGLGVLHLVTRGWVKRLGRLSMQAQDERFRITAEAFGGIKEVKVLGREQYFVDRLGPPAATGARAQATVEFSFSVHRYSLEALAFATILVVVGWLLIDGRDFDDIVPFVGLLGIAGYRLLPAFRDIANAFALLSYSSAALQEISTDLDRARPKGIEHPRMRLRESLDLRAVSHHYADGTLALQALTATIPAGALVALAGASGSGKSTLANVVMGLLRPFSGQVVVDGKVLLEADVPRWQRNIGYVPQEIFLTDASIGQNIAFALPEQDIDMQAVARAARIAQLEPFIASLPSGYATPVGERGVKLSGGQRQRIGIARALYSDPDLLVLDEATSDLDGETEIALMEALRRLAGSKTVLVIAHRTVAIRACPTILFLQEGRLAGQGTFDDLKGRHASFHRQVEGVPTKDRRAQ